MLAAYLYGRRSAVELISPWVDQQEVATSIVAYGEVVEHIKTKPNFTALHDQLREVVTEVAPFFLTYAVMERYADLRLSLRRPYGPGVIGDMDTLIAATALERDLTVVTTDSDFERVPELELILIPRHSLRST